MTKEQQKAQKIIALIRDNKDKNKSNSVTRRLSRQTV